MFRVCLQQARSLPSTSRCGSFIHTSAILQATKSRNKTRSPKKYNIEKQQTLRQDAQANRPSVVLGTRPKEEVEKWKNCDLAKLLVDENELYSSASPHVQETAQPIGTVHIPKQIGFGVDEAEKTMLFTNLPYLSAQAGTIMSAGEEGTPLAINRFTTDQELELQKANAFARILDLRNANAAGISYENRRRIILAFSGPENPFDPGRAEVQAALLTYKIRNLWSHLVKFKRDVGNRLGLRKLVHKRAKILRYLKGVNRDRYEVLLERLALEPGSVEGELVV